MDLCYESSFPLSELQKYATLFVIAFTKAYKDLVLNKVHVLSEISENQ